MIDWARVSELRSEVGEEEFGEVVEIFLEEVEEVIAGLKAGPPDAGRLQADLHFLKGGALNLGFTTLAEICKRGEHAAAGSRQDEIDLQQVFGTYEASKARFMAESGADSAPCAAPPAGV